MMRVLRYLWYVFLGLLGLTLLLYVLAIHPNDARMTLPSPPDRKLEVYYTRVSSLLLDGLKHQETLDSATFAKERKVLFDALPDYALPSSVRFSSPYQIYVPVGSYPLKLDAQDGVFIPTHARLIVETNLSGNLSLRFAVVAPKSAGTLTVQVDAGHDKPVRELIHLDLPKPIHPDFDANKQSYKNFWRFVHVDARSELETWQDAAIEVTLRADDKLVFSCEDAKYGCVVSDPTFYRKKASDHSAPPNVLVILVDTLRSDAVHGGNAPQMAALADSSVDFTQALAPGNMTSPSTNALLACRRPSQLGELAFAYTVTNDYRESYYKGNQRSFPRRFLTHGYDTAMIGNVSVISEIYGVGINHGFARQISLETDGYDTPAIARDAVQWLGSHGDHPFLLYLHFNGPHAPYRAPLRDIFGAYPGSGVFRSYANTLKWLYQGEVAYTDRYVKIVLKALETLGLADNTWVVLTADHGDQHTQHDFRGNTTGPDFSGAYFDHGATLLNDEIHVPLIIHKTGLAPRRVDQFVSTLDLGPTLLGLTGADSAAGCAGDSLAPYLKGEQPFDLVTRTLGSEGFHGRAIVFDNRYKYIRTYEPTDKRIYGQDTWTSINTLYMAPELLFDLQTDPSEEHNLNETQPELLSRARQLYRKLFAITDSYELVVESSAAGQISSGQSSTAPQAMVVNIPGQVQVQLEEGSAKLKIKASGVEITGPARERYLIEIRGALSQLPMVTLGGRVIPVAETSMRLPLDLLPGQLQAEMGGRYTLLSAPRGDTAYSRRVEDDGQKNRRILTGNPAFEKVLREWGYLNDK